MSATTTPTRLVLVGSVVVDVKVRVPTLPHRGGDVLASGLSIAAGGGSFVLQAARAGGLPVVYAGRHGTGRFGDLVRESLAAAGVALAFPPDQDRDTGPCLVLVEPDGERTMITVNGVEAELPGPMLQSLDIRADDAVYVSGYDLGYPVTGPAVADWVSSIPPETLVVVDPGPLVDSIADEVLEPVLRRTDVLSCTVREAELLTGRLEPAGDVILPRLAAGAVVVLRDGAREAVVCAASTAVPVPVDPVEAGDTTGAGDLHTGALISARATGMTWLAATRHANVVVAAELRARTAATV